MSKMQKMTIPNGEKGEYEMAPALLPTKFYRFLLHTDEMGWNFFASSSLIFRIFHIPRSLKIPPSILRSTFSTYIQNLSERIQMLARRCCWLMTYSGVEKLLTWKCMIYFLYENSSCRKTLATASFYLVLFLSKKESAVVYTYK